MQRSIEWRVSSVQRPALILHYRSELPPALESETMDRRTGSPSGQREQTGYNGESYNIFE